MTASTSDLIRKRIYESGRLLDRAAFDDYIDLFLDDSSYRVEVQSPELQKGMTWVLLDKAQLSTLLRPAKLHMWDTGQRHHLINVETIDVEEGSALAESNFCVFRTDEEGATKIYAVGKYYDHWQMEGSQWRMSKRTVRLETRMLSPASAVPL